MQQSDSLVICTQVCILLEIQIRPGFKLMNVSEAKQGKPVRTDSHFLSATFLSVLFWLLRIFAELF